MWRSAAFLYIYIWFLYIFLSWWYNKGFSCSVWIVLIVWIFLICVLGSAGYFKFFVVPTPPPHPNFSFLFSPFKCLLVARSSFYYSLWHHHHRNWIFFTEAAAESSVLIYVGTLPKRHLSRNISLFKVCVYAPPQHCIARKEIHVHT